MTNEDQLNPYDSLRRMSEMLEKGFNNLLFQSINHNGLIQMTMAGLEGHSRYIEFLKKNRELMANFMNLSTKTDIANVAKLTLQAEEKIDILEEQIWSLQESFVTASNQQQKILEGIMEYSSQIHNEWIKAASQLENLSEMKNDLEELKVLLRKEKAEPELLISATK